MCLSIYNLTAKKADKLEPKIAKKPIKVYKSLENREYKEKYNFYSEVIAGVSPYKQFRYNKGFHYYNGKDSLKKETRTDFYGREIVDIHEGLHAYKHQSWFANLVEMWIPKGARYYENDTEIVSTDLIWY